MDNLNENKRKLEVVATGKQEDETCQTFVMHNEDHTLGNSLRYMIMKKNTIRVFSLDPDQTRCFVGPDLGPNCLQTTKQATSSPDVQFCGYSIPHPSESKINFRVQTYGKPANDILRKGLKDLNVVCEHVLRTFETSVNEHKRRNQSSDIEMVDQSNG